MHRPNSSSSSQVSCISKVTYLYFLRSGTNKQTKKNIASRELKEKELDEGKKKTNWKKGERKRGKKIQKTRKKDKKRKKKTDLVSGTQ
jgi:hypothetical protein